jgi:DNA polymerase III delta prime subunit
VVAERSKKKRKLQQQIQMPAPEEAVRALVEARVGYKLDNLSAPEEWQKVMVTLNEDDSLGDDIIDMVEESTSTKKKIDHVTIGFTIRFNISFNITFNSIFSAMFNIINS